MNKNIAKKLILALTTLIVYQTGFSKDAPPLLAAQNDATQVPAVLPLHHYEKSLRKTIPLKHRKRKHAKKPTPKAKKPYEFHTTLPSNLSRPQYLKYVANELGWVKTKTQADFCPGTYLVPQYIKDHPLVEKDAPIEITAQGPEQFKLKGVSILQHNIIIKQPGRIVRADKVYVFRDTKTGKVTKVSVRGNVRIYEPNALLVSDEGIITFHPRTISIKRIAYLYHNRGGDIKALLDPYNAWGTASSAHQDAQKIITLRHATYSTCSPLTPTWQFYTSKLVLDRPDNIGRAYNMVFRIKHIPVFYFPYYSFPLNNERKSGLLFPTIGQTSNAGAFVGLPLYLNLAPNYDWLLTPEYYGRRGFRLESYYRYLTEKSNGFIEFSFLPNDQVFSRFRTNAINTYSNTAIYDPSIYNPYLGQLRIDKNFRGMINAKDITHFNDTFSLRYFFNVATDPYYLTDVSAVTFAASSTDNQLLNLLQLQDSTTHWDNSFYIQGYQTLHLITQIQGQGQALDQYRRLPDFNTYAYYPLNKYLSLESYNEYGDFNYKSIIFAQKPQGSRFHIRPGLSLDLENSAAYFKPEVWYDLTAYTLNTTTPGIKQNSSRLLPIADIDMGLHLLRDFKLRNETYQQTLEPRVFYLYVPFTNQEQLPNFDTIELPFFFDQLYALNTFQGYDRIENANQFSLGLSSSIIRGSDGTQIFNVSVGDTYYVSQPKVCLIANCQLPRRNFSPLIANFSFYPDSLWSFTGSIAWDPKFNVTNNAELGLRFNQDGHRIINLSYLYVSANPFAVSTFAQTASSFAQNPVNFANSSSHIVLSFTWPLGKQIRTLGHLNYDLRLNRLDSTFVGVQYDSCCWAIRFIVKRLFDSSTFNFNHSLNNAFEMSYFVELTFKGLGSFGNAADTFVQSIVPGYKP